MNKYPPVLLVFLFSAATSLLVVTEPLTAVTPEEHSKPTHPSRDQNHSSYRDEGSTCRESKGDGPSSREDNPSTTDTTDVQLPPTDANNTEQNSSDILDAAFNDYYQCQPKNYDYYQCEKGSNRAWFMKCFFSKNKINPLSFEAQEISSYFYRKALEKDKEKAGNLMDNRASVGFPSWQEIFKKAEQPKNFNKNFSLFDRKKFYSYPVKAKNIWARMTSMSKTFTSKLYLACLQKDILKKALSSHHKESLKEILKQKNIDPDSEKYRELHTDTQKTINSIIDQLEKEIEDPSVSLSRAVHNAHLQIMRLSDDTKVTQSIKTSLQFSRTAHGWTVIKEAPPLKNLVLSGGGVKGVGYVGFLKVLEALDILKSLESIVGTSAGAMTAAFIASGMDAEAIEIASNTINAQQALFSSSTDPVIIEKSRHYKDQYTPTGIWSGNYILEQVNQQIINSITNYFSSQTLEALQLKMKERKLTELEQNLIDSLKTNIESKQKTHLVTFKELSLLHKLDPKFKDLTVTAFSVNRKTVLYLNAESAAEESIARAVTISASLPMIYKAREDQDSGDMLVDGSIGSNIPREFFDKENQTKAQKETMTAQTLVLAFDEWGKFNQIVYGNIGSVNTKPNVLEAHFSGNPNFEMRTHNDIVKLHDAGPNALYVKHGDLATTSFLASKEKLDLAKVQAEIHAWQQLALRQNQAIAYSFQSLDEAILQMTDEELQNITNVKLQDISINRLLHEVDPRMDLDLARVLRLEREQEWLQELERELAQAHSLELMQEQEWVLQLELEQARERAPELPLELEREKDRLARKYQSEIIDKAQREIERRNHSQLANGSANEDISTVDRNPDD